MEAKMPKTILIFSDGTGQVGGLRPDQRLSNVYKMYRAMRPGPDSPISPVEQVAFYDPGLGAGEAGGLTFKRTRNFFASAVGSGIDENIIDCYEAIIANYEDGDRVCLFGFSRGAYTVRCVANVMNLCGVPAKMADGSAVPTNGPRLRKIAEDAVKYVYNHGAGKDRKLYFPEREAKAERFRKKYHSNGTGMDGESQGNVQPNFIGVFDTVAALGSRKAQWVTLAAGLILWTATAFGSWAGWTGLLTIPLAFVSAIALYWVTVTTKSQLKYFRQVPGGPITSWHFASWNLKNYDMFLDNLVRFARHAISIDENRKSFPRVGWGHADDYQKNAHLNPAWLEQVWFSGNHSDIGGSYPEAESRLSDVALRWMVEEFQEAVPEVRIQHDLLVTTPDSKGLQHDEVLSTIQMWPEFIPSWLRRRLTWSAKARNVNVHAKLHPSVFERLKAVEVPHIDCSNAYRPANLRNHSKAGRFFN
jgi:uncharacterized protein (DUF2235 family)